MTSAPEALRSFEPPGVDVESALQAWRARVLSRLLVVAMVTSLLGGAWFLVVLKNLSVSLPVMVIGVVSGALSRSSGFFTARAALLLAGLTVSAAAALLRFGFLPIPFVLLSAMSVFATVLLGRRAGVWAAVLSVGVVLAVGALHTGGVVPLAADWVAQHDDRSALVVARIAGLLALTLALLVLAPAALIERAEAFAIEASQALVALQAEQAERQRLADALRLREVALQRLKEQETIGRLAATAVHDFNNALAVMAPTLKWLEGSPLTGPQREAVDDLRAATEQAAALTHQLRALGPQAPRSPTTLSTAAVLRKAQGALGRVLPSSVQLELDARDDAAVVADEGQLLRALTNLVLNARDALTAGGTITLRVVAAPRPGFIALEVVDTGEGMSEEVRARALEPWFTTKGERGSGLGLASVLDIVTEAGGELTVDSAPGRGTTVSLLLPKA